MSKHFTFRLFTIFMVATIALSSCVSKKKFDQLMNEKGALANSLTESQNKVNMLEQKVTSLEAEMASEKARLNGEISGIKKDLDAAKAATATAKKELDAKNAELANIKKEIKDAFGLSSDVTVENRDGNLYVTLDTTVNYRSGVASLNRDSRKTIDKLAQTMKNNPDLHLLIEGHTDSDKYPAGSGMDNWQLSVNRSMAVVKRLIKQGVKPEQLTVAGRGETAPLGSDKGKNRRTEVKPSPKTGTLYNIGN